MCMVFAGHAVPFRLPDASGMRGGTGFDVGGSAARLASSDRATEQQSWTWAQNAYPPSCQIMIAKSVADGVHSAMRGHVSMFPSACVLVLKRSSSDLALGALAYIS